MSRFAFLAVVRLGGLFGGVDSAGDGMNFLGLTDLPLFFILFLGDEGSWLSISSLSCLWFYRDLLLTYGSPLALPVTLSYLGFLLDLLSSC